MKKLIVAILLTSISQVFASDCPPVRAFSCTGLTAQGDSVAYYVSFEEMMKVLSRAEGKTYDENQGFGTHTNCQIPTGRGSAMIRFDERDDFRTGSVNAKIKTPRGMVEVYCEELRGGF